MLFRRTVQPLHHVAMILMLVLALAACARTTGSPATPTTPSDQQASIEPEPDPEPDPEPQELSELALTGSQLVIYSGRTESLVGSLIERFEEESGIEVAVRYGGTAELAATILEEGPNSPADVFYAQDAGALGALAKAGRLQELSPAILDLVDARFRSPEGLWVGTSGRARVVVYNTERLSEDDLPDSVWGFTDPEWKGRIGWAPTNGSFQAFVTALRILEGDDAAREWLSGILANDPKQYPNNTTVVDATANGEVDVGFVNHYYLYRFLSEAGESFPARNYHPRSGGAGALINVAGAGILDTAGNVAAAHAFIDFLLSEEGQRYFAQETHEYPLIAGVEIDPRLTPLSDISAPDIDLSNLDDLRGTLELLQEVGAL